MNDDNNNNNNNMSGDNDNAVSDHDSDDDVIGDMQRDYGGAFMNSTFGGRQSREQRRQRQQTRQRQEHQFRQQQQQSMMNNNLEMNDWERKYAKLVYEIANARRVDAPSFDYTIGKENLSNNYSFGGNKNSNSNNHNGNMTGSGISWKSGIAAPFSRFLELHKGLESEFDKQYHSVSNPQVKSLFLAIVSLYFVCFMLCYCCFV